MAGLTLNARSAKAFDNWTPNWQQFVERNVGAWMHIEHILGLYVFAACNRSGPTNMHNTAMAVNIETYPTHITSLPVAVNLQCHSARSKHAEL